MVSEPINKLGLKALSYMTWSGFITSIFLWLIPLVYYILAIRILDYPSWILIALIAFLVVLTLLRTLVFPRIKWGRWRYEISEHDIDLCYGLWVKTRTIIPMVKVQHVDTKQGPLMKAFVLSSIRIATAAGEKEIPALSQELADELRERISILARLVDEDV